MDIRTLFSQMNGTYLEVGAFNGEFFSNTLLLERDLGWTGILIEPVPDFYNELLKKGRRAAVLNACVSPTADHHKVRTADYGVQPSDF